MVASCLVRLVVVFFALACFGIEVLSLFVYLKVYFGCASLVLSFYLGICKPVVEESVIELCCRWERILC